ncbi:histidine kinase [Priestia aryabhattai]|uniref:sensor histidine kinase n=1 Tax=Priestia aryabhattai TaxID=412384 RepID=UPI003D2AF173
MLVDANTRLIKVIATIAMLYVYFREYANQGFEAIIGCSLIILLYIVLLWTRQTWWNGMKYAGISLLIITIEFILYYLYGVTDATLLWPLVWILATVYNKYRYLSSMLALFTIVVILCISWPFSFRTPLILVGVFIGVLIRKIRKDSYRLKELHLQELNKAHQELQEAHAELQEATMHSMKYAALEERIRLAREIHDGLGHQLTSLIVQLQALEIMLPGEPKKASETITQLLQIARQAMGEVRVAVREWSSDEMGLGLVALKGLVSQIQGRSSIKFNFIQESEISEWPNETSIVLYRTVQESLTNILRHSNATLVTIYLKEVNNEIILSVSDNGNYVEETPLKAGFGLKGMMERCRLHGGTCTFTSVKPHGLCIEITLPIDTLVSTNLHT